MKKIVFIITLIVIQTSVIFGQNYLPDPSQIKFKILYNDIALNESFIGDQGFSCLIEIDDKSYLFDAGNSENILANNTNALGIDCSKIESIYISHLHTDHICGLSGIIDKCKSPILYLPSNFAINQTPRAKAFVEKTLSEAEKIVSKTINIQEACRINEYFYSTGPMEEKSHEQALIIDTSKGLIVMVGCSHPGTVEIIKQAKLQLNKEVYFVMGGFHLGNDDVEKAKTIAGQLKGLTKYIAACHCTEGKSQEAFKNVFQANFIEIKAGLSFQLPE